MKIALVQRISKSINAYKSAFYDGTKNYTPRYYFGTSEGKRL